MKTDLKPPINHLVARGKPLPPLNAWFYEYVFAGNGLFIRADRPEFAAMIPIARQQIKGLPLIEPYLKLTGHKIPKEIVLSIWSSSVLACDRAANPVEALFHIQFIHQEWKLDMPPQEATLASCRPLLSGAGSSYLAACVECHSHGAMPAFFSSDDNLDEVGLRIYAVLGRIFSEKPEIAVRIGIYGHYMRIPANWVFELPIFISDTEEENG